MVDTTAKRIESGKWLLSPFGKMLNIWEQEDLYSIESKLEELMASRVNEVMFDDL